MNGFGDSPTSSLYPDFVSSQMFEEKDFLSVCIAGFVYHTNKIKTTEPFLLHGDYMYFKIVCIFGVFRRVT